ncbi:MAG: helix-turn-helix domain-containing protein [Paracoccaceae bacterium]|nr:helix-turn-helix domain-containing protein [Paracoccaceae bacterium]
MDADTVMGKEHHPEMKGFDSYELTLGDELRGERASKGKSLLDVQRDLRIRADYIDAIENSDASAFPFAGFAAGYVRSYARYLDIDPDDVYRRF